MGKVSVITFILSFTVLAPGFELPKDLEAYKKRLSRRPGASLTEQTHKLLTRAQEDLSSGAVERAFAALEKLEARTEGNKAEQAQVIQALGFAYAQRDQNDKALEAFERTLALDALPEAPTLSVIYLVGQLYALKGDHKKAEKALKFYLSVASKPSGQAYAMLAGSLMEQALNSEAGAGKRKLASINSGFGLQKKKEALAAIQKAIDLTPEPKESWLAMAVSLYFANEKYKEAARVLKVLVAQNPKKETYWKQWAQSHLSAGEEKEGLVAMEMGHVAGVLKEDKDIKDAASMMLATDLPYKAALWMEKKLSAKERGTLKNQKILASAYMMARENQKAVKVLKGIHKTQPEVQTSIQLGQILLDEEKWDDAKSVFNKAKGLSPDIEQKEQIQLGLGVAYYNLGDVKLSRESFVAVADKSEAAQGWLKFIQSQDPQEAF